MENQQLSVIFTADEMNNRRKEYGELIKTRFALQGFARQFVGNFMQTPTEPVVAASLRDYYVMFGSIVADEERNIYAADEETPGLWVLNEHFAPVNGMLFLYAAFDVIADVEPALKDQEKAIASALKIFDRFNSGSKYKALVELMLNYMPVTEMDSARVLLFQNGVAWNGKEIITDTAEIKKYHLTTVCPYDLAADIPAYIQAHQEEYNTVFKFLCDLATVKGNSEPTEKMKNYEDILNFLGYVMTLKNRQKQFFVFWGETTNNGKSTFLKAVSTALGKSYSVKLNSNAFAKPTFRSKQEFSGIGEAKGKVLAYASEPDKDTPYDAGFIKDITNGVDVIRYARKYSSDGEMTCDFIPAQECNNIPHYDDDSLITSGRVIIIPFKNEFERGLNSPLEAWQPCHYSILLALGINQALQTKGLFTWHNSTINEYIKQNDTVGMFIAECTEPTEMQFDFPDTAATYSCYTRFVRASFPDNIKPVSVTKFNAEMNKKGYKKVRITVNQTRRMVFSGITLKNRRN